MGQLLESDVRCSEHGSQHLETCREKQSPTSFTASYGFFFRIRSPQNGFGFPLGFPSQQQGGDPCTIWLDVWFSKADSGQKRSSWGPQNKPSHSIKGVSTLHVFDWTETPLIRIQPPWLAVIGLQIHNLFYPHEAKWNF